MSITRLGDRIFERTRVVERAVDAGEHGEVGVRREKNDDIVVRWLCGDKRVFNATDAEQAVDDLELLEAFPDVWLELMDSNNSAFVARIVDGELYADAVLRAEPEQRRVPWKALRKAVRKATERG